MDVAINVSFVFNSYMMTIFANLSIVHIAIDISGNRGKLQLNHRVIPVFYYDTSSAVNDSHDVALEVVDAAIERSVEARHRRAGLRIVEVYCLKTVPEA